MSDKCSYQVDIEDYVEGDILEVDVTKLLGTEIFVYQGLESLQNGNFTLIRNENEIDFERRKYRFTAETALFLVTDFTSNYPEFMVEFRKNNVRLEVIAKGTEDEEDDDPVWFGMGT